MNPAKLCQFADRRKAFLDFRLIVFAVAQIDRERFQVRHAAEAGKVVAMHGP